MLMTCGIKPEKYNDINQTKKRMSELVKSGMKLFFFLVNVEVHLIVSHNRERCFSGENPDSSR